MFRTADKTCDQHLLYLRPAGEVGMVWQARADARDEAGVVVGCRRGGDFLPLPLIEVGADTDSVAVGRSFGVDFDGA